MSAIDSGDYGFLVSQLGIDVTKAADQQLISASSWRNMMIQTTGHVTLAGGASTTVPHGLGYPGAFMVYEVNAGETHLSSIGTIPTTVDSTNLTITNGYGVTMTIRYFVYRIPLNVPLTSPIFKPSTVSATVKDKDIGIKVMKPGKKQNSTDYRDYNYHSGTRSPMIHKVLYAQSTSQTFTDFNGVGRSGNWIRYINDLGYVPIFLGYYSTDNITWSPLTGLEASPPKLFVWANGDIGISDPSTGHYGCIIAFKDPFSVGTVTTVTI